MSNILGKRPFTEADLPDVRDFDCGGEPYEVEVANWLKGPAGSGIDSAANSINHPDTPGRVWLYTLEDRIVGFGALAKTSWRWPGKNNDPRLPLSIIIWVGVRSEYRGKPDGPKEGRFAVQILDDLMAEAEADAKTHPVVGLFVHKDNRRAIRFYKEAGFSDELVQRKDKTTGEIEYYKMFVILDDEALEACLKDGLK